jgi:cytochrome c oxidase assembly factor CtaG
MRSVICIAAYLHAGEENISPAHWFSAWSWEPLVVVALAVSGALYIAGAIRMRGRSPEVLRRWEIAAFISGWFSLVVALVSPLHRLGSVLFSAHMTQHELLMLIAAPLLIIGRAELVMLWAFPLRTRVQLSSWKRVGIFSRAWLALTAPLAVWLIHGATLWIWHLPSLYQATLESEWVHAAQHTCFLATALLFWWTLIHGRHGRLAYGAAVAYVFTTGLHSSALGALLTFAPTLWYPIYDGRTSAWGLSALEDQQLGGLIMWVPAGIVFIVVGLALFAAWLAESERRLRHSRSTELARASAGSRHA